MHAPIRKAVFPVAGLGTRFLPATKAMPKEMLTVVDRPLIQYVVEEARAAGIEHFILVTGRNKAVIEDHFDIQVELESDAPRARPRRSPRGARPRPARPRPDELHPPAGAARPRPRRVVRPRTGRQRAFRRAPPRHDHAGRARLPVADGGRLQRDRRQRHRRRGMRSRSHQPVRHRRRRRERPADGAFRITAMVEKPEPEAGAVEPLHQRPLHPAAGHLRPPRRASSAAPATRSS